MKKRDLMLVSTIYLLFLVFPNTEVGLFHGASVALKSYLGVIAYWRPTSQE